MTFTSFNDTIQCQDEKKFVNTTKENPMKKALSTALMIAMVLASGSALAKSDPKVSGFVEVMTVTPAMSDHMTLDAGISLGFEHGLSSETFFLVSPGYAEAYTGIGWAPLPWLMVSAGLGAHQSPDGFDLQTGYLLWLGHEWFSFCGIVEVGEKAYQGDHAWIWYDLTARAKVTDWLTLGIKDRRPDGIGPLVELTWPAAHLTGWIAWTPLESEKAEVVLDRFMMGAKLGF